MFHKERQRNEHMIITHVYTAIAPHANESLAGQKDGSAEHIYAMNRHLKIKTYEMTFNFSPFRLR